MASWSEFRDQESNKEYFKELQKKIDHLCSDDISFFSKMFPPRELIYRCFDMTPLDKVRVVIIGQDPYHGDGQANGLAFAVNEGVKIPPSLRNIIKESGCTDTTLVKWAQQGVLLLNTTLTVMESKPMSCADMGWETFTDNAIKYLLENSDCESPLVFVLWGSHAQAKKKLTEGYEGVTVLEASHPSPLSANISFNGCDHFKKINEILEKAKQPIIMW